MGCSSSSPTPKRINVKVTKSESKAGLNPKDFIISNINGSCVIRNGDIKGQAFNIEECSDSSIFLFDHLDSLTCDLCVNSKLFIGPTANSVFLRDCSHCDIIVACKQFRMRGCSNCRVLILSTTSPSIESSSKIGFGCINSYFYFDLEDHFRNKSGLNVWVNQWFNVYDFTPGATKNFFYMQRSDADFHTMFIESLQSEESKNSVMEVMSCAGKSDLNDEKSFIPFSSGSPEVLVGEARSLNNRGSQGVLVEERARSWTTTTPNTAVSTPMLVLIYAPVEIEEKFRMCVGSTNRYSGAVGKQTQEDSFVIQTTCKKLAESEVKSLCDGNAKAVKSLKDGAVLFAELYMNLALPALLSDASLRSSLFQFWGISQEEDPTNWSKLTILLGATANEKARLVFEQWKYEV